MEKPYFLPSKTFFFFRIQKPWKHFFLSLSFLRCKDNYGNTVQAHFFTVKSLLKNPFFTIETTILITVETPLKHLFCHCKTLDKTPLFYRLNNFFLTVKTLLKHFFRNCKFTKENLLFYIWKILFSTVETPLKQKVFVTLKAL